MLHGGDPHRPIAHLTPRVGWLNDPHGLLRWQERYHLFFQHHPHDAVWGPPVWAHVTSPDLATWQWLPHALTPDMPPADDGGCWSGSVAIVGDQPQIFYTGVKNGAQTLCKAVPTDATLHTWRKDARNPRLGMPGGVKPTRGDLRDPWVWRMPDGTYRMLQGTSLAGRGNALLYASDDGDTWTYRHPLVREEDSQQIHPDAGMWEMPVLLPVEDTWLLIIGAWMDGMLAHAMTAIGRFDGEWFQPERVAPLDHAHACVYAPHPLMGEDRQRTVWMAWMQDPRSASQRREAGWAGALTLPRELWIEDGELRHRFAAETRLLQADERRCLLTPGATPSPVMLDGAPLSTRHAALRATVHRNGAKRVDLTLHADVRGAGGSTIELDFIASEVRVRYAEDAGVTRTPDVAPHPVMGDTVDIDAILDGGVLELIIDERVALTTWLPPTDETHARLFARADGGVPTLTLRVTPLHAMTP